MRAHRKLGKKELKECQSNQVRLQQKYQGKLAIMAEWEEAQIENDYTQSLRAEIHRLRTRLQNMGAL